MKKHTLKEWLVATRPWSFPASAMPVVVTLGYLFWEQGEIDWPIGVFTIINVVLFHAAGNTWSDYRDFKSVHNLRNKTHSRIFTDMTA